MNAIAMLFIVKNTFSSVFSFLSNRRPNADILLSESAEQSYPGIDLSVEKYLRFVKNKFGKCSHIKNYWTHK